MWIHNVENANVVQWEKYMYGAFFSDTLLVRGGFHSKLVGCCPVCVLVGIQWHPQVCLSD